MNTESAVDVPNAPDWSAVCGDVACPMCDYNLRGLAEPRCPECGYAFAWPDLLDPARRRHPFLFEHHPEHNVRSFARTWLAGLWPPRFWHSLSPVQGLRRGRLLAYWIIATLLGTLLLVVAPVLGHVIGEMLERLESRAQARANLTAPNPPPRIRQLIQQHGSVDAVINAEAPSPFTFAFVKRSLRGHERFNALLPSLLTYAAWPWVTYAVLMIFQQSMTRAKVNPDHVLRCVLYSCDAAIVVGLIMLLALPWADSSTYRPLRYLHVPGTRSLTQIAAALVIAAWTTPRLASAYARYLRFDHPLATALASQVIVALLVVMASS